jgi:hypothetical protein
LKVITLGVTDRIVPRRIDQKIAQEDPGHDVPGFVVIVMRLRRTPDPQVKQGQND